MPVFFDIYKTLTPRIDIDIHTANAVVSLRLLTHLNGHIVTPMLLNSLSLSLSLSLSAGVIVISL